MSKPKPGTSLVIYQVKRCPWCKITQEHWKNGIFWYCTRCGRPSL